MIRKRLLYCFSWLMILGCFSIAVSSCEDESDFESLEGIWFNKTKGYIRFRNDGSGYFQEQNYKYGEKLHSPDYFVYENDVLSDSLIFLNFEDDGFRDTLKLSPINANEIKIDGTTYLKVKREPVYHNDCNWNSSFRVHWGYSTYEWKCYQDGDIIMSLQFEDDNLILKDEISGTVEHYNENYYQYSNDQKIEAIIFKLDTDDYYKREYVTIINLSYRRLFVQMLDKTIIFRNNQ